MDGIELMIKEHEYIKEGIKLTRSKCLRIVEKKEVDVDFFHYILDFFKNYADKHHHGKEEDILFDYLRNSGGELEKNLINAMEIEHNWGRLMLYDLEKALNDYSEGSEEAKLDIIGNAVGYANLLTRHIDKEDNALFNYARESLESEKLEEFHRLVEEFENSSKGRENREKYLDILNNLKSRE